MAARSTLLTKLAVALIMAWQAYAEPLPESVIEQGVPADHIYYSVRELIPGVFPLYEQLYKLSLRTSIDVVTPENLLEERQIWTGIRRDNASQEQVNLLVDEASRLWCAVSLSDPMSTDREWLALACIFQTAKLGRSSDRLTILARRTLRSLSSRRGIACGDGVNFAVVGACEVLALEGKADILALACTPGYWGMTNRELDAVTVSEAEMGDCVWLVFRALSTVDLLPLQDSERLLRQLVESQDLQRPKNPNHGISSESTFVERYRGEVFRRLDHIRAMRHAEVE